MARTSRPETPTEFLPGLLAGRCRYHADRDAVAVCMRCTAAICPGCTTKLDGVNHCRACLEALRAPAAPAPHRESSPAMRAFALLAIHGAVLLAITGLALLWQSRS